MRRYRLRVKLLAAAISLLIPLGLLEIALRVGEAELTVPEGEMMIVRSADRRLIYELRPSHEARFENGTHARTNAQGFRGADFARAKTPGVLRIAAVGDSITFGLHVDDGKPFPALLGGDLEVFNFGVPGYNSLQEVALVESRVLDYAPDLILLAYALNDNKEDGGDGGHARYFTRSASRAYDWFRVRAKRLYRRTIGPDVSTEAFEHLAELARARKIPVAVILFPMLELDSDGSYGYEERHAAVRDLSARLGFAFLDLYEPFLRAGFDALRLPGDRMHPNEAGHRLAAEEIARFLATAGRLSSPSEAQPADLGRAPEAK